VLSRIVRGFERDLADAEQFVRSGMVDVRTLLALVETIPASSYARYPHLSSRAVERAVGEFVASLG